MKTFMQFLVADLPIDFIVWFGSIVAVSCVLIGCSPRKRES